jgi:hypothetical protein
MGKNQDAVLLTNDSDTELSNRFSDFFLGKIQTIRDNLQNANETNDNVVNVPIRVSLNAVETDIPFSDLFTIAVITGRTLLTLFK